MVAANTDWLPDFLAVLAHSSPAFVCDGCSNPIPIRHIVAEPASAQELSSLHALAIPDRDEAVKLFSKHNGFHLYAPVIASAARGWEHSGVKIFPLSEWPARTAELRNEWIETYGDSGNDAELPYGKDDFLAIGHPLGSWNYIHWITKGPQAGKIYWWPWSMPPEADDHIAPSFPALVSLLHENPVALLTSVFCGYSGYFEPNSKTRLHPSRYLPDAGV